MLSFEIKKNILYFRQLIEIWTYDSKVYRVCIFTGLLQYFSKNRAILCQKLGAEKKMSNSTSGYFMTIFF